MSWLVTGGSGYIGAPTVRALLSEGEPGCGGTDNVGAGRGCKAQHELADMIEGARSAWQHDGRT